MKSSQNEQSLVYAIKIKFMDQLNQCNHSYPSLCPLCKEMRIFNMGEEGFYILVFDTLEDTILWKLHGHIHPAPHFAAEGRKLRSTIDKIDRLRDRRKAINAIFGAREDSLTGDLFAQLK